MRNLIKQAVLIPLLFFVPVFVSGILIDGYNFIQQHASEITLTDNSLAKTILNSGAVFTGLSCVIMALGIVLNLKKHYLSSFLLAVFGVSMISNGMYPMGTAMHGLYGAGLTLMILPFIACYELKNEKVSKLFFRVSLIFGSVIFVYLWSMLVGLDPANYKGLTQRIASMFIFGWIAYFAFELTKTVTNKSA